MTPKNVTTIDLNDLKELELKCECGAAIRLPLPLASGDLIANQTCPACPRQMWTMESPVRYKVQRLLDAVKDWKGAGYQTLSLRFVITEESMPSSPTFVK